MAYFTSSQVVRRKTWFSASVTGTPTAQLYIDNVATGSAVNGTGSGAEWSFELTLPAGLTVGSSVQIVATATVSSWTERRELADGFVVSLGSVPSAADTADAVRAKLNAEPVPASNMRGTDGAYTGTPPTLAEIAGGVSTVLVGLSLDQTHDKVLEALSEVKKIPRSSSELSAGGWSKHANTTGGSNTVRITPPS